MLWPELQELLSVTFNVHPSNLHIQYRLSTEQKGALPANLTSQRQLDMLLNFIRPRRGNAKKVVVNLFNKHTSEASQAGGNAGKVKDMDFGVCSLLICSRIDRMLLGRNLRDCQTLLSLQDLQSLHSVECLTPTLLSAVRTGKQS